MAKMDNLCHAFSMGCKKKRMAMIDLKIAIENARCLLVDRALWIGANELFDL